MICKSFYRENIYFLLRSIFLLNEIYHLHKDIQILILAKKFSLQDTRPLKKETTFGQGFQNFEAPIIIDLLLTDSCKTLTKLEICASTLTDESLKDLLLAPSLEKLTSIILIKCEKLSENTYQSICVSPSVSNLTELVFYSLKIDDEGLRAMSSPKVAMKSISTLKLTRCTYFTDRGMKSIMNSENFQNLKVKFV